MRQPGIVGIHCLTSANALHYAYQTSAHDDTRKLVTAPSRVVHAAVPPGDDRPR